MPSAVSGRQRMHAGTCWRSASNPRSELTSRCGRCARPCWQLRGDGRRRRGPGIGAPPRRGCAPAGPPRCVAITVTAVSGGAPPWGRGRCWSGAGCAAWRHRPAAPRSTSTPTSTTNSGRRSVTSSVSLVPHPAENDQPVQGCQGPAGARGPATVRPAFWVRVVVRSVYCSRPPSSYLLSSRLRGEARAPVTAPTIALGRFPRHVHFRQPLAAGW